jgi:hypothetical protein
MLTPRPAAGDAPAHARRYNGGFGMRSGDKARALRSRLAHVPRARC